MTMDLIPWFVEKRQRFSLLIPRFSGIYFPLRQISRSNPNIYKAMRKFNSLLIIALTVFAFTSCGEATTKMEDATDAMENATESATEAAGEAMESATEATGEAMDAAETAVDGAVDAAENAADAAETAAAALSSRSFFALSSSATRMALLV